MWDTAAWDPKSPPILLDVEGCRLLVMTDQIHCLMMIDQMSHIILTYTTEQKRGPKMSVSSMSLSLVSNLRLISLIIFYQAIWFVTVVMNVLILLTPTTRPCPNSARAAKNGKLWVNSDFVKFVTVFGMIG